MMNLALTDIKPYSTLASLYYILTIRQRILDDEELKRGINLVKNILKTISFLLVGFLLFYQTKTISSLVWSKLLFFIKLFNTFMIHVDDDIVKSYFYKNVNNSTWVLLIIILTGTNLFWLILPSFLLSSNSDIHFISKCCIYSTLIKLSLYSLLGIGSIFKLIEDNIMDLIVILRKELYDKDNIINSYKSDFPISILKSYGIYLPSDGNPNPSVINRNQNREDWSATETYLDGDIGKVSININNSISDKTKSGDEIINNVKSQKEDSKTTILPQEEEFNDDFETDLKKISELKSKPRSKILGIF